MIFFCLLCELIVDFVDVCECVGDVVCGWCCCECYCGVV